MRAAWSRAHPVVRVVVGAVAGMILAIGVGLVAVALADTEGFGDLAAAAVTIVFGLPAGAVVGGFLGYWLGRSRQAQQQ